jgi:hypothetical protein
VGFRQRIEHTRIDTPRQRLCRFEHFSPFVCQS